MKDECQFEGTGYNSVKGKCGKPESEHCTLTYKECVLDIYSEYPNVVPKRCKKVHHPFHRLKERKK